MVSICKPVLRSRVSNPTIKLQAECRQLAASALCVTYAFFAGHFVDIPMQEVAIAHLVGFTLPGIS